MAHEALSYEVFRSSGIAAPRTGYARVTVNGTYKGMYLNLETYDDVMLEQWFPETDHLYEGSYGLFYDVSTVENAYSEHYQVDEGDEANRSDLQNLLDTANDFLSVDQHSNESPDRPVPVTLECQGPIHAGTRHLQDEGAGSHAGQIRIIEGLGHCGTDLRNRVQVDSAVPVDDHSHQGAPSCVEELHAFEINAE
jgi:hypothetical protein